ncbi:MAG: phage tail protein [Planctomycetota bacterium]|jgi:phage tail-like protein
MRTSHRFGAGVAAVAALGICFWAVAGPLTPPAGPVADTSPSLADLDASISALAGAGAGPADTATTPGDSTDGRPLMTPAGFTGLIYELEIAGFGTTSTWEVVEFGESVSIIEVTVVGPGGLEVTTPVPGRRAIPQIVLVRDLSQDPTVHNWWGLVRNGNVAGARTTAALIIYDGALTEIARWNLYNCWPSSYEYRAIDGRMAEQLVIVGEDLERVFD